MRKRSFGLNSEELPVLGLGCSRIGSFSNPASSADTARLLECSLELGVALFDTADIYGQGDSERAIGRVLRHRRNDAFVVTKVGKRFSAKMRVLRPFKPLLKPLLGRSSQAREGVTARRDQAMRDDFSSNTIRRAIDASLRRLRFDTIDGLLLHSPDADTLATSDAGDVLARAFDAGKIRHYGVACDDLACLNAALRLPGLTLLEIPPDVLDGIDSTTFETIERRRIGVIVREVIRFRGALSPCAAVDVALQKPGVTSTVVGTSSTTHLRELAGAASRGAASVVSLDDYRCSLQDQSPLSRTAPSASPA